MVSRSLRTHSQGHQAEETWLYHAKNQMCRALEVQILSTVPGEYRAVGATHALQSPTSWPEICTDISGTYYGGVFRGSRCTHLQRLRSIRTHLRRGVASVIYTFPWSA